MLRVTGESVESVDIGDQSAQLAIGDNDPVAVHAAEFHIVTATDSAEPGELSDHAKDVCPTYKISRERGQIVRKRTGSDGHECSWLLRLAPTSGRKLEPRFAPRKLGRPDLTLCWVVNWYDQLALFVT